MITTSYWLDTAPAGPDRSTTTLPDVVDVVVVGGGLTGLSAALHLRRKGASVAVLEAERMGWGASGRNGGMCTTGLSIGLLTAIKRYGFDTAKSLFLAYDDAIDTVERLIREEGIDCSFGRAGKLNLASKPAHFDGMVKTNEVLQSRFGRDSRLIPPQQLGDEIGSDRYFGGLLDPRAAGLHVGKFVKGMAEAAAGHGAQLHERARVTTIKRLSDGFDVATTRGNVTARQVLVATDGYTDGALPAFRRRVVPVGSFIVVTAPLDRALVDTLMPTRRMASDSKNLLHYFRITPDDRMLFGGRAQFALSSPDADRKSAEILTRDMIGIFPQLHGTRIDYAWGGLVGMTLDRVPHAGQRGGIHYSLGYNGHGVQMATYMGRQMVEVMDGHLDANPWKSLPFRAVPGHFGPPWFLPFADAYYRLKDVVS
jgi:glycine/D-amino acid oxidase-like deaminating enzyme